MKSVVFESFGEPQQVLTVREVPDPQPASGQVAVRVLASPINPSDLMTIRGVYGKRPQLPATPGFEGVGIVESGRGMLGRLLIGKRVAVLNRSTGNWCERTVVPARQVIPIDNRLTDEQAAMFFVNPATAWVMTRDVLNIQRGEWLLQSAAASALGRMVIRLGQSVGFHTINVVRSESSAADLRSMGAQVVVFDPLEQSADMLRERVCEIVNATTNNRPTDSTTTDSTTRGAARGGDSGAVHYAIDPVGGATGSALVNCLAHGGRMLVYGTLSDGPLVVSPRQLMTAAANIEGFWLSNYMESLNLFRKLKLIRRISRQIINGTLAATAESQFPLDQVADAVQAAERPGRSGKVLLRIGR